MAATVVQISARQRIGWGKESKMIGRPIELPNAAGMSEKTSPLYFLHIPKTAGTTFNHFLETHFPPEQICTAHLWRQMIGLPPEEFDSKQLIWGHFYGFLCRHIPINMRYVTLMRHPVDRALSHYGHVLAHAGHYLHDRAVRAGSIGAYLEDPELATTVTNFHVRSLAVDMDPHAAALGLDGDLLAAGELERRLEAVPVDGLHDLLDVAKIRLKQMCFVGLTERYEESIQVLCRMLGWRMPDKLETLNAAPDRLKANDLDAAVRSQLTTLNAADQELYNFACGLFEKQLATFPAATSSDDAVRID